MGKFRATRCDVMWCCVVLGGLGEVLCDAKGFSLWSHHHRSVLLIFPSHYQRSIFPSVTEVGLWVRWESSGRGEVTWCDVKLRGVM